jgi:hypothetical protein
VGGVVGHDGQLVFDENGEIVVDANGNPVYSNPTGIYAKIEGVGNEIQTAISNLPDQQLLKLQMQLQLY